jgi:hypothetical protein
MAADRKGSESVLSSPNVCSSSKDLVRDRDSKTIWSKERMAFMLVYGYAEFDANGERDLELARFHLADVAEVCGSSEKTGDKVAGSVCIVFSGVHNFFEGNGTGDGIVQRTCFVVGFLKEWCHSDLSVMSDG